MECKKLYKVTLMGMKYAVTGCVWGISYAVASNPEEAYQKVLKFLKEHDIGFEKDRVLYKIELVADTSAGVESATMLYL